MDAPSRAPRPEGPKVGTTTKILVIGAFFAIPTLFLFVSGFGQFDPFRGAADAGDRLANPDPAVPPFCFAKTAPDGASCLSCHAAVPSGAPGVVAATHKHRREHPWHGLEQDLRVSAARITEGEVAAWIRTNNLTSLSRSLRTLDPYDGPRLQADFRGELEDNGFLADESGWRALNRRPFPGLSWPVLVGPDQIFRRLPALLREDAEGRHDPAKAWRNDALLDAALSGREGPHPIPPSTEAELGLDVDGDGQLDAHQKLEALLTLPPHYVGTEVPLALGTHPEGTEYLQWMGYPTLEAPFGLAPRVREIRHAVKTGAPDPEALTSRQDTRMAGHEMELRPGSAREGFLLATGWRLRRFVEDRAGRLRVATVEEHMSCVGCHESLPQRIDGVFTPALRPAGGAPFGAQAPLSRSAPAKGPHAPATWLAANGRSDLLGSEPSLDARWFEGGTLRPEVRTALESGDPSRAAAHLDLDRARAIDLIRFYRVLVDRQEAADFHWPHEAPVPLRDAATPLAH